MWFQWFGLGDFHFTSTSSFARNGPAIYYEIIFKQNSFKKWLSCITGQLKIDLLSLSIILTFSSLETDYRTEIIEVQ